MTWWHGLYDDLLAEMFLVRADAAETQETIDFLERELRLRPGDRVFDQCSGIGSLSTPLASRGFRVRGVEQSERYVERAVQDGSFLSLPPTFSVGDAFEFVCSPPAHGAFNWWTSFGYAKEDHINAQMLGRARESLLPGGRFALDFMNVPGVLRGFECQSRMERKTPLGDIVLTRESEIDLCHGFLHKIWTYYLPDGQQIQHESEVRLYMPWDLAELALSVGFSDPVFFGGTKGQPLTTKSPRCILVVQAPGGSE